MLGIRIILAKVALKESKDVISFCRCKLYGRKRERFLNPDRTVIMPDQLAGSPDGPIWWISGTRYRR